MQCSSTRLDKEVKVRTFYRSEYISKVLQKKKKKKMMLFCYDSDVTVSSIVYQVVEDPSID